MLRAVIGTILGFALLGCSGGDHDSGGSTGTTGPGSTSSGSTVTSGPTSTSSTGSSTTTGGTGGTSGTGGGTQQLSVKLAGGGMGTVTSSPAGIDCSNTGGGGPCGASFATGTMVTLTATPSSTSRFDGWTNGPCSGTGPCTVTLDTFRDVTAAFTQGNVLTVNVTGDGAGKVVSSPPGIDCTSGSTQGCSYGFANNLGSQVNLTVTPAAGSSFAGWSFGGCSGSSYAHTCPVPLSTSGSTVTVSFSAWQARQPFPSALGGLASFKGTYVAVGSGAAAATSPDGATWTGQILATQEPLRGIGTDGTIAVAVGDRGTLLTTTDTATWTPATSGSTVSLAGVAFGAGTFVVVGAAGTILTSSNGTSWSPATSMTNYDLLGITFGGGQFVAVGYGGTVLTSADGRSWAARTSMTTQFLSAVTFGSGRWVAVGSAGAVVTSPDAMTWTAQTPFTTSTLRAVASASGSPAFVASGDAMTMNSPSSALVFTSDDGASWTPHDTGAFQEQLTGMVNLGGAWYALGNGGSVLRSSNGTVWNASLTPGGRGPIGSHDGTSIATVAFGNAMYVAAGNYGAIFSSPDGRNWTSRVADRAGVSNTAIVYGGTFVVTQNLQGIWRILGSSDGRTWMERGTGPGALQGVAYGGASKGFVAVGSISTGSGYTGVVATSPDGMTWTPRSGASITSQLTSIAFGADLFAATGLGGSILTSPDGVTWTPQASPIMDSLGALAFGNGVFVAVGMQNIGQVTVTSTDGIAWKDHKLTLMLGGALTFGKGTFMSSALHTSTDGVSWTASGGMPEGVTQINGGIFTSAVYGPSGWVGGSLFETFLFHP